MEYTPDSSFDPQITQISQMFITTLFLGLVLSSLLSSILSLDPMARPTSLDNDLLFSFPFVLYLCGLRHLWTKKRRGSRVSGSLSSTELAPEVGFEPKTLRLTADPEGFSLMTTSGKTFHLLRAAANGQCFE